MKIPLWLITRFDVPDAIVGDILERASVGKSGWWIWRQAIGAIAARSLNEARQHPWIALRGVALGALLLRGVDTGMRFTGLSFDQWLGRILYDYLHVSRPMMLLLVFIGQSVVGAPCWFAIGWLVARWHPRFIALIPLAFHYTELLPVTVRQVLNDPMAPHSAVYRAVHISSMLIAITIFTAALLAGAFIRRNPHAA